MSFRSVWFLVALAIASIAPTSAAETLDEALAALDVAFAKIGSYSMKTDTISDMKMPGYESHTKMQSHVDCKRAGDSYLMRTTSTSDSSSVVGGQETTQSSKILMICDGERTYVQSDDGSQVTVSITLAQKLDQIKPSAMLTSYRQMGDVSLLPDREENGIDGRVIKLQMKAFPGVPPQGHSEFCFRKDNGLMWANRGFDADGKVISSTTCSDLDTSADFEDSHFAYTPPEGAQVIDMTDAEQGMSQPQDLPGMDDEGDDEDDDGDDGEEDDE